MPRPKVHPDQRKRVVQACLQCKASKKKCNASLPCQHCVRRGQANSCHFPADNEADLGAGANVDGQSSMSTLKLANPVGGKRTLDEASSGLEDANAASASAPAVHSVFIPGDTVVSPDVTSHGSRKGEAPNSTRPRMLSNTHGEQLYIGGSASLSFLQLVRETVTQVIGSSEFSEHAKKNQMLEVDIHAEHDLDQQLSLRDNLQREYLDHFFLTTSGVLDVVSRGEAAELVKSASEEADPFRAVIGLTVLAIGAQNATASPEVTKLERLAFLRAQRLAFSTMLENPSVDITRAFLLMSYYMLGACRRNAAFMYLGISARSAYALGLHNSESYKVLSKHQKTLRHKTWKSLVCLDLIVSSILGRAPATAPHREPEDRLVELELKAGSLEEDGAAGNNNSTAVAALEASYQLALLVDDMTSKLYSSNSVSVEAAELHLQTLRNWSENLPADLRLSAAATTQAGTQQQQQHSKVSMIASLHVSSFYYFAVMLITRPFLIADLTRNLATTQGGAARGPIIAAADEEEVAETGRLVSSCLNAAVYMAQTCADMLEMGILPHDMRLLKAWAFAAGLVLGFQIFGDKDQDAEIEHAFSSTRNVLKHLAERSPQAAHYFDILTSLSNAITKQRQIRESRKRRRTEPLVDRIMNLSSSQVVPNPAPTVEPQIYGNISDRDSNNNYHLLSDSALDMNFTNDFQLDPQLLQQDFSNVMFGWDSASLGLWDQFPFDGSSGDTPLWNATGP